jgi:hypothetical protein
MTPAHDPPGSLSFGIKDQQAPAAIVPADPRACLVDGTVSFRGRLFIPEKRACLGTFGENALIKKEPDLVGVDGYRCFFTSVLVVDQKTVIPEVFFYYMDLAQIAAAFPALPTFKRQRINLTGNRVLHSYTLTSPEHDTVIFGKNPGIRNSHFDIVKIRKNIPGNTFLFWQQRKGNP